ncbi:hypothetical protein EYC54_17655 [Xanthomonas oryzae]|uniref:hypothetical protein n=1 Tax=Xanthomonas oryzae TaxID=347 RepID=UPI0010347553|nr:hypothetical protein [Xanthomonas oryzae]QBG89160.1 hypothetical protein EYC54_17655 [Xanthomonas oryzae]
MITTITVNNVELAVLQYRGHCVIALAPGRRDSWPAARHGKAQFHARFVEGANDPRVGAAVQTSCRPGTAAATKPRTSPVGAALAPPVALTNRPLWFAGISEALVNKIAYLPEQFGITAIAFKGIPQLFCSLPRKLPVN